MTDQSRGPTMSGAVGLARRGVLVAGLAGLVLPRALLGTPLLPADRVFAIHRDGKDIGRHEVRFSAKDRGFEAVTEIDLAIKLGFLTVYSFRQSARDLWRNGVLLESFAETDDDGDQSETVIRRAGDELIVEGGEAQRRLMLPVGTMTDISFWNMAIVRERALLNIQRAQLTEVESAHVGSEVIELDDAPVQAERFAMAAKAGRHGEIWFDAEGNWVKGIITTRGETLEYRLLG